MKRTLTIKDPHKFVERLRMAMDEVPITKEEARQILADYSIDANDWWEYTQMRVAESDQRKRTESKDARFAAARQRKESLQSDIARWKQRQEELARRPQPELVAMLNALRSKGTNIQVFHRKLEAMTNEDLASLIAHYEDV